MIRYLSFPAIAVLVASCAPISEDECRGGDWGAIGLADGKKGAYASLLNDYAETCAEFGVAPVRDTYLQARAAGLKFYCTPESAYRVGRSGKRLNNVCEPLVQQSIRPAYERGETYFKIEQRMDELANRVDELRDELSAAQAQPATPVLDSRALQIKSQINDIRHDIFMLELERDRYDTYP